MIESRMTTKKIQVCQIKNVYNIFFITHKIICEGVITYHNINLNKVSARIPWWCKNKQEFLDMYKILLVNLNVIKNNILQGYSITYS